MAVIFPKLEVLPEAQKMIWPFLKEVPKNFVLYGGTAVALRYGHRHSVDFDFFSSTNKEDSFEKIKHLQFIKTFNGYLTNDPERERDKYGYQMDFQLPVNEGKDAVNITFADYEKLIVGSIKAPDQAIGNNILIASPDDLMATKIKAMVDREEVKDYVDVCVMIQKGVSFSKGFEAALLLKKETLREEIHKFNSLDLILRDPECIADIFKHATHPELRKFSPIAEKVIPKAASSLNLEKLLKSKLKLTKDLSHEGGRMICQRGR